MEHGPLCPAVIKETVRRHWDRRAPTFDEAPNHGLHGQRQRGAWLTLLRTWAGPEPIDALDVGCGTGFLALLLAHLGHRVAAVDMAEEMLRLARHKAEQAGRAIDFRRADAEHLAFADASFDLLVERHVLWTLPDPAAALAEWSRVLRPGGRLVLIEGDWEGAEHADYEPIRGALPLYGGRPSAELVAFVAAAGLADVAAEPLMDAIFWGRAPERERYALHARKP